MSTNDSEVDVLFATKRKRQQAEEAQKEAQKAEEERIQELERQKKQMLEDIQRLEAEKAQQAAEAEQAAIAARAAQAEREAQAARAAQEAEAARAARAAEAARLAQEAQAAKAAMKAQKAAEAEQRAAAKAMAKASAPAQPGGIKKYLPFIIAGGVAVIAIIVVVIVIATSGSKSSEKKTADNDTGSKSKSNIENMSDPPEDEEYGGEGEEIQEYDEDYGQTIDSVIADAEWVYVVDETSGRGFQYPACFDMYPDSGDGYYQFNYNGSSSQGIGMALVLNYLGEEELKKFIGSTQDDRNHYGNYLVNTAMQNSGVASGEYTIDSFTDRFGQETYYAYTAFDTASSNGNMYAAFVTWQDGCIIQVFFVVSKEADGHPRFADFGNLTNVYVTMLEGIVDTSTAKG